MQSYKGVLVNRIVLLLGIYVTCSTLFAGTMGPVANERGWVASFSLGPVWHRDHDSQTFYLAPEIEKTYKASNSSQALAYGEIFLGMQRSINQWQGQLGLAFANTSDAGFAGQIWDDASPQFNNYSYHYDVTHTHVAVKGKLLADRGFIVIPWISASLGVGFNRAHDFTNAPLIFEAIPNPNFSDHTETAFTYTLGAGVQKALTAHWQVGIGYEFADWGKSHLGRASGQTLNDGLALDHVYTNGVLANLTYVG